MVGVATPSVDAASRLKVVIIVGPVEGQTASYIADAKQYAAQTRSYGARVTEIYSPNATWARVVKAVQGANLVIYLGHGNGSPSPYGAFSAYTKDGFGLNAQANHGNSNRKYYGEYYVKKYFRFAKNAVVILNHLCYSAGSSEPGKPDPTLAVAKQRVDNFGAGFLRANARAVFALATSDASPIIDGLFHSPRSFAHLFMNAPDANMSTAFSFSSKRTPGAQAWMDPSGPTTFHRSLVGWARWSASTFRKG